MKKINTTTIAAGVAYPPSKKGFDFLQSSYQQVLGAIAQGLGGERVTGTEAYVLYGCVETNLGAGNFSYTAGWIMHGTNAECYYMAAIASIAIPTAAILTITTTPDPVADPTTFTDGSSQMVHDVRTLVLTNGALGSGSINYADLIFVNKPYQIYTPTFAAYTSADVLVAGGVTVNSPSTYWLVKNNRLFIDFKTVDLSTTATVRYVTISLPTTTLINGKAKRGNSFCRFMRPATGSSGLPVAASVDLTSAGAGDSFRITKADNSDFGGLTTYDVRFSIEISLI